MVTLRRDVAACGNNKIFDRPDRDKTLTEYDIFMEKKNASCFGQASATLVAERLPDASCFHTETVALSGKNYFGHQEEIVSEPKDPLTYDNYSEYLMAQFNRKKKTDRVLTKEEFYALKFEGGSNFVSQKASANKNAATAKAKAVRKLSKNAKIFIAAYVLIAMVVASIIIAVNAVSVPNKVNADAISEQGVASLEIPVEKEENNNWFDKLLDGLSNK